MGHREALYLCPCGFSLMSAEPRSPGHLSRCLVMIRDKGNSGKVSMVWCKVVCVGFILNLIEV